MNQTEDKGKRTSKTRLGWASVRCRSKLYALAPQEREPPPNSHRNEKLSGAKAEAALRMSHGMIAWVARALRSRGPVLPESLAGIPAPPITGHRLQRDTRVTARLILRRPQHEDDWET